MSFLKMRLPCVNKSSGVGPFQEEYSPEKCKSDFATPVLKGSCGLQIFTSIQYDEDKELQTNKKQCAKAKLHIYIYTHIYSKSMIFLSLYLETLLSSSLCMGIVVCVCFFMTMLMHGTIVTFC